MLGVVVLPLLECQNYYPVRPLSEPAGRCSFTTSREKTTGITTENMGQDELALKYQNVFHSKHNKDHEAKTRYVINKRG